MAFSLKLSRSNTANEIDAIVDWYNEQQMGRGKLFLAELNNYFLKIESAPFTFKYYFKEYRVANLKIHPYQIFYEIIGSDVVIMAVEHSHRKPAYIRKKLKNI